MLAAPPPPVPLLAPPEGYVFGRKLPAGVVTRAREVLQDRSFQYGDSSTQIYNGVTYIHRIEPHYDDHVDGILRWHRGVTVYQPAPTVITVADKEDPEGSGPPNIDPPIAQANPPAQTTASASGSDNTPMLLLLAGAAAVAALFIFSKPAPEKTSANPRRPLRRPLRRTRF